MAVQASSRLAGKVTIIGAKSCMKVGATAEREGGKEGRREGGKEGRREGGKEGRRNGEAATTSSLQGGQICIFQLLLLVPPTHQSLIELTSNKQSEVLYIFRLFHIAASPHCVDSYTLVHVSWCVPCVTVDHIGERQHPRGPVHWSHVVHLGDHLGEKGHTAVR